MKRSNALPTLLGLAVLSALAACHTTRESAALGAETDAAQVAADPSPTEAPVARQEAAAKARADVATRRMREAKAAATAPPPPSSATLDRVEVTGARLQYAPAPMPTPVGAVAAPYYSQPANTEKYAAHEDNPVHRTSEQPVSTFSIDVDTGSYANVRRMLNEGVRPPSDAVRAEEFINYFDYGHPAPATRDTPFRVTTELAAAPWNAQRQVLMIGIKGFDVPQAKLAPANLVFLIDTSGSMDSPDKLPLVKEALRQLVPNLRAEDRVSMVVYAGSAGLVLPPTPGDRHEEILAALDRLDAGGSTNGGDGIRLAYAMARQAYVKNGVNRVILATDGDFNVGTVDQNALETLVGDQRRSGVALTTLGFGTGNYNDQMAERLADVGDGNHAYIDSVREARKVLVQQMGGTLMTIARDVKIQIEFNPAQVAEYRLIGYENRVLRNEDFANDRVDAGDIGAGHQVTALYEITPTASSAQRLPALRYGVAPGGQPARGDELAHLRLRYKLPGQDTSRLIETPVRASQLTKAPSDALSLACTVAGFADALRGGERMDGWSWEAMIAQAHRAATAHDRNGERRELVNLMQIARGHVVSTTPRVGVR